MEYFRSSLSLRRLALILGCFLSLSVRAQTPSLDADLALFEQALQLSSSQQWSKAEPLYRELLERHQHWPEPRNNLAVVLLHTNRLEEARQMLEQAVNSHPSFKISQANRTKLYEYMAAQAYDRALGEDSARALPGLELIKQLELPSQSEVSVTQTTDTQTASAKSGPADSDIASEYQKAIQQQLIDWASAWSEGEVDAYLNHYAPGFEPSNKDFTLEEWKNHRRAVLKFSRDVKVALDHIRVFVEPSGDFALAEFTQRYRSDRYSDEVLKQLYLQRANSHWQILSERVIKTY